MRAFQKVSAENHILKEKISLHASCEKKVMLIKTISRIMSTFSSLFLNPTCRHFDQASPESSQLQPANRLELACGLSLKTGFFQQADLAFFLFNLRRQHFHLPWGFDQAFFKHSFPHMTKVLVSESFLHDLIWSPMRNVRTALI